MTEQLPDSFADRFEEALSRLENQRFGERLWQRDHTLWSNEPTEIADRLGWLDLLDVDEPLLRVTRLVEEARIEEIDHVVLLGMGGSSLGGEALAATFGPQSGYPRLLVLD